MSESDESKPDRKRDIATRLVRTGRGRDLTGAFVNPPVIHASTVLFDSVADLQGKRPQRYVYGRRGTPTTEALQTALAELEGATGVVISPSGLSAAAVALLSCVSAGDRVLMVDTVYQPVRHFTQSVLKRLGVETDFFDPALGAGVAELMRPETRVLYAEAPGSLTFEMLDLPAMAAVAHGRGMTVIFDNSWATPVYFRPLDHGADIAVMSATKHLVGHSDAILGTAAANAAAWPSLKETHGSLGTHVAPDDVFLTLRGLRTLAVRLERQTASAMKIATWLAARPEVDRVLFPPLPSDPGHALWRRDMTGACGLFSFVFAGWSDAKVAAFIDGLELFGIGVSWGGFESLAIVTHLEKSRSVAQWSGEPLVRLYIGLEDPDDLLADLAAAFDRVAGEA